MTTAITPPIRRVDPRVLLERVGVGSREAFSALYDEVGPRVHGLTMAGLSDPATAATATEAVFLQVWRQAPRYRPAEQDPIRWIVTITVRVIALHRNLGRVS